MANFVIYNKAKYDVGFKRPGDVEVNVHPGRFVNLTDTEVLYEAACMQKWLADGVLKCEDDAVYELLGITREKAVVACTDEEIIGKLKLNIKQFKQWLDGLDSAATLQRVFDVACGYDALAQNKVELIEKATGKSIAVKRKQSEVE